MLDHDRKYLFLLEINVFDFQSFVYSFVITFVSFAVKFNCLTTKGTKENTKVTNKKRFNEL